MFKTIDRYEEDGLGLPYPIVLVDSAIELIDDETGERLGVSVPDMEQLVAAVAMARVLNPAGLRGAEVRFIRRALGKKAKELAGDMEISPETLSRWENDKQPVGEFTDKQLRMIAVIMFGEMFPHFSIDTKTVVSMKLIKPYAGDAWPEIMMHRVPTHQECEEDASDENWDAMPIAA